MISKKLLTFVVSTLITTGCQSITTESELQQSATVNASNLNESFVERVIDTHSKINLEHDFTIGQIEYQNQVYGSIALQQAQLAGKPVYFKFPITLTKAMYDGDLKAFIVPVTDLQLDDLGSEQEYGLSVILSDKLWVKDHSNTMNRATWSKIALKTIAISELSSANNVDGANSGDKIKGDFYNLRAGREYFLPNSEGEFFTQDEKSNVELVDTIFKGSQSNIYASPTLWVDAYPNEASQYVGKKVTAVIALAAVFQIQKTKQYVVVGHTRNNFLVGDNGQLLSGEISNRYHYSEWMAESILDFENIETLDQL
ncbi:hypothetical protein FCV62_00860 [Vibrio kanaloae]|uniref:hypothetical protein n=1 Tax=Vibrio kanaloae TaxID=170673 RepID=UPI0010BF3AB8|nr:hypothetical protein [Vibrio kanaloae]TKF82296.1 hypothetical protein FCV62_00860 [Vibrio kanaloae]